MRNVRILYIKKKSKTKTWSDVLDKQFRDLKKIAKSNDDNIFLLEVNTTSIKSYFKSAYQINKILKKEKVTIIYVNHIICSYVCLIAPAFHNKTLFKILALHESEPVLGWKFAWTYKKNFPFKELVRYTKLFHYPLSFFNKILILNKKQAKVYFKPHDFTQLNFLGIDVKSFKSESEYNIKKEKVVLFFPHNPKRFEKGYEYFINGTQHLSNTRYEVLVGGQYAHKEMRQAYKNSHIIYLTGYYETYSLVMLEAMANNKYIIANENIGLVDNLLEKYSYEELESYGIFLSKQNQQSIWKVTEKVYQQIKKSIYPKTCELLLNEGLDDKSANLKLYDFLRGN